MKKLIFDNKLVKIYDEGHKDIFNRKVFKRYPVINEKEVDLLQDKNNYDVGIFVYLSNKKDSLTFKLMLHVFIRKFVPFLFCIKFR